MAGRGANNGDCAHSCRWKYKSKLLLQEEIRPDEYYEMSEDDNGSYILNSKDLCLMPKLAEILSAGFDSLKIEGRNKSAYYAAQTARVSRKAIDDYFENPPLWKPDIYMRELNTLQNRGYTLGFFDGIPSKEAQDFEDTSSRSEWRNAGRIISDENDKTIRVEVHHKIKKGDTLEVLSPSVFEPVEITIDEMFDTRTKEPLNEISAGRPAQSVDIILPSGLQGKKELFARYCQIRIKK
jgi:putative protease